MAIKSHSTGDERNVAAAWTTGSKAAGPQSPAASTPSSAADVTLISYMGSGDDQLQWNGQIVHSSAAGTAAVTFHAFITGGCHMSGVGTVAN